jgi:hypothetical protein
MSQSDSRPSRERFEQLKSSLVAAVPPMASMIDGLMDPEVQNLSLEAAVRELERMHETLNLPVSDPVLPEEPLQARESHVTYEELIQRLRELDAQAAPAIEEALPQIYKTDDERHAALLDHLRTLEDTRQQESRARAPRERAMSAQSTAIISHLAYRWGKLRQLVAEQKPDQLSFIDETHSDSLKYGRHPEKEWRESVAWLEGRLQDWSIPVPAATEAPPAPVPANETADQLCTRRKTEAEEGTPAAQPEPTPAEQEPAPVAVAPAPEPAPVVVTGLAPEQAPEPPELAPGLEMEPSKLGVEPQRTEEPPSIATWLFRVLDELGPKLPPEMLLAYLHCWRLADWKKHEFLMSDAVMATRLGIKDRRTGAEALRALRAAGVIRRKVKGHPGHASVYQLAPLSEVTQQNMLKGLISSWWDRDRKSKRVPEIDAQGADDA